MFINLIDVLILKNNFKTINIILIHFQEKNNLKSNYYYTPTTF